MPTKLDWIHLPPGTDPLSLWPCLHDARIHGATSDRLARTLHLDLDVFYIRKHHGLPDSFRFTLGMIDVESARATQHILWPGECVVPAGSSRDDERRIIDEYRAKWREESFSWDDFERAAGSGEHEILEASLVRGDRTSIHLSTCPTVATATNHAHEVFVRAEAMSLVGSDGTDFGIERFLAMGEAYWEAFGSR